MAKGELVVEDLVRRRATKLATGFRSLGAPTGTQMPVLVCEEHVHDRRVACLAIALHGSTPIPLAFGDDLKGDVERHRGGVLVACAEGVAAWRETGVPMRVVGDGADIVWWKALELRGAP
jgi:hypothetical protein